MISMATTFAWGRGTHLNMHSYNNNFTSVNLIVLPCILSNESTSCSKAIDHTLPPMGVKGLACETRFDIVHEEDGVIGLAFL